jgi:dCTP deaminase
MQDTYYLSDRGIQQAVEQGLVRFNPPLEDKQIQPASIDLLLDDIEETFPLQGFEKHWKRREGLWIPAHSEAELRTTQEVSWDIAPLKLKTELRSSMRRLSCYTPVHGLTMRGFQNRIHVEANNPSSIDIQLSPRDKIAQLLFFFFKSDGACLYESGIVEGGEEEKEAKRFERLSALDHGRLVQTRSEALRLLREGYFSVKPYVLFEGSLVKVHAGKTAKVLRHNIDVNFSKKQSIDHAFEDVVLPYRLMPGEHIVVDTRERLKLSPHIGIHFYDRIIGTSRHRLFLEAEDSILSNMPDGWVDPGYEGSFSRQPKTYRPEGVVINPGELLGHGVLIHFPNPVERAYGSAGLGSHYQGQTKTQLTQEPAKR